MTLSTIDEKHFDGGQNLDRGGSKKGHEHLAQLVRKRRHGRVTTGDIATGTEVAVTFDTAYADTDYTITGLSWEDVNGATAIADGINVKKVTKATTGFTVVLTASANLDGVLHWSTEHD